MRDMRTGRWLVLVAGLLGGLALPLLNGCGAATLFSVIDFLRDNDSGNDDDEDATIRNIASIWTVQRYSGENVGTVDVPATAEMEWVFSLDGSWRLTSAEPVSVGSGFERRYNERGQWRIRDASRRILELTPTQRAGEPIPGNEQDDFAAQYTEDINQLVIQTDAFGPGDVRYVMRKTR